MIALLSAVTLAACASQDDPTEKFETFATDHGYSCTDTEPAAPGVEHMVSCESDADEPLLFVLFHDEQARNTDSGLFTAPDHTDEFGDRWMVSGISSSDVHDAGDALRD